MLQHKMTILCAPPGYGKTTLAAQFAQSLDCPVAWHTIEEPERDVPNLHAKCIGALGEIVASVKSVEFTRTMSVAELAASVANHLRGAVKRDIVFVIDEVQVLSGSSAAELWLRTFATQLPATCHVIMISRTLPDLPLTELIARRELLAISQEALRFTTEEVQELAQQVFRLNLPTEQVEELVAKLEGWAAGIVLALQPLPHDLAPAMLSGGGGPEGLFDALADVMLNAQSPGLRDFLLMSSTLTRLTPELAATVLEIPGALEWMSEALTRNLFMSRVSGGLVYHRLFREFLQRRLAVQNIELFTNLHIKAARWFEQNYQTDEAIEHYLTAGLVEPASAMIDQIVQSYQVQGRAETLLRWNESFAAIGIANPNLSYVCATILSDRYKIDAAVTELDKAEKLYAERLDSRGRATVQLQRARIDIQRGQYFRATETATPLLEDEEIQVRGTAMRIIGFANLKLGRIEQAIASFEEALPLYKANGDQLITSNLLMDMELAYRQLGRLEDAAACLQEVVAIRRALKSTDALAQALNNLGYHYHQCGDYVQASATFQEGLSVIAYAQNHRTESYLRWSLGDLLRDRGSFEEAVGNYNLALELIGANEPSLRCNVLTSLAVLRRWQGNYYDAALFANEALILSNAHNLAFEEQNAKVALWAARAHMGEVVTASKELDDALVELNRLGAKTEAVTARMVCAHLALLRFDKTAAERYVSEGAKLIQNGASMYSSVSEIMHTPLLEAFVARSSTRYADLLQGVGKLRKAQLKPTNIITLRDKVEANSVYSLRVQTLGKEIIERDGVLVLSTEWRAAAARELFFYLLFGGAQSRERISLDFWPDSTPSRVRSNFHTTLYRVRQALGENIIVFKEDNYCVNPDLDIWCDAHEFEALVNKARPLSYRDARTEDLWFHAATLYQGEFLPQLEGEWVGDYREMLNEYYLECLVALGECARARNDLTEAIKMYKQALKVDPYREDIHRALINGYAARGERRKIYLHYRDLQELLSRELGVEPSRETIALVKSYLT
ncbi:MAG: tetratricopeptide repeat protein [Anaerolineae bacterium]|nr:tetratricopeptide repeat protein [Anaerolineae bacterium]